MKYTSPKKYYSGFEKELVHSLKTVIDSDNLILGKQLEQFEDSFARANHSKYCIGINSCTDALMMCLIASGIKQGDEVITTSITAPATIISIIHAGAIPVIVDVAAPTFCICTNAIQAAISTKTRAIVPVHLHGFPAEMEQIVRICKTNNLLLIEDCAQASGAIYKGEFVGNFGIASAFSFYPTKNIGCLGDGGAVITNNKLISKKIKSLRFYGFEEDGKIRDPGFNSRMDELQAAFLNVLLPDLDNRNNKRVSYAKKYHDIFGNYTHFLPPLIEGAVYHQFPLRVPNRKKFINKLNSYDLQVGIHYPYTMSHHPAFQKYCSNIKVAEKVVNEFVSIPIQPEILDNDFTKISNIILKCLKEQ